jgi:hypothetical protein
VDVLHQVVLVTEDVTLGLLVEGTVEVAVNLLLGAVLPEKTTENAKAAHPQLLGGHAGLARTLLRVHSLGTPAGAAAHVLRLADDVSVLDQLADGLAGVGVADLGGLVGVKPNAEDVGGKTSLELEHICVNTFVLDPF